MTDRDYYDVLGVSRDADQDAIKRAYRQLAMKWHPDRNDAPEAEDRFKEISEAYAVLSDPEKRQVYDRFGHAGVEGQWSAEDLFQGSDIGSIFREFGLGDLDSVFRMFFGGGGSPFQGGAGGGGERGRDLLARVEVPLGDVVEGTRREVRLRRRERCETCGGSGAREGGLERCRQCGGQGRVRQTRRTPFGVVQNVGVCPACAGRGERVTDPCPDCGGEGRVERRRSVDVEVPAGIEDGTRLRLRGQGEAGRGQASDGDLFVEVHVSDHESFERDGQDLHGVVEVTFAQAALGTEMEVPTLKGNATIKVPAGTQSGSTLRLKGQGLPTLGGGRRGDLLVHVHVRTPERLTPEMREALERLGEVEGDEPPPGFLSGVRDFLRDRFTG